MAGGRPRPSEISPFAARFTTARTSCREAPCCSPGAPGPNSVACRRCSSRATLAYETSPIERCCISRYIWRMISFSVDERVRLPFLPCFPDGAAIDLIVFLRRFLPRASTKCVSFSNSDGCPAEDPCPPLEEEEPWAAFFGFACRCRNSRALMAPAVILRGFLLLVGGVAVLPAGAAGEAALGGGGGLAASRSSWALLLSSASLTSLLEVLAVLGLMKFIANNVFIVVQMVWLIAVAALAPTCQTHSGNGRDDNGACRA